MITQLVGNALIDGFGLELHKVCECGRVLYVGAWEKASEQAKVVVPGDSAGVGKRIELHVGGVDGGDLDAALRWLVADRRSVQLAQGGANEGFVRELQFVAVKRAEQFFVVFDQIECRGKEVVGFGALTEVKHAGIEGAHVVDAEFFYHFGNVKAIPAA